jgi:hypothetical protein
MVREFEELQGLGYRGGYDAVRRYAAGWYRERSQATAAAYLPFALSGGQLLFHLVSRLCEQASVVPIDRQVLPALFNVMRTTREHHAKSANSS